MIFIPKGLIRVRPIGISGTPGAYQDPNDPTQVWTVNNRELYQQGAGQRLPATAQRMVVMPDGDRYQIGISGGMRTVRHIRPGVFDRHLTNDYDLGRQKQVNWRARWLMRETDANGQPIKVECNPTMLGGTAGTGRLFPSPGIVCHSWAPLQKHQYFVIDTKCSTVKDFDPHDMENGEWTDVQFVEDGDTQTQAMWTTVHLTQRDSVGMDGVWRSEQTMRLAGGTPDSVASVLFDRLVSSFFASTMFDGGCVWIDATNGNEVRVGQTWAQNDRPEWNCVYQRKSTGEPGRVDTVRVVSDADKIDFPFPGGKAILLLPSGSRGVPDNVSAIGFGVDLAYADAAGMPIGCNSIKVSPARVGQATGLPNERGFVRATFAAESIGSWRRGEHDETSFSYWWCHGTPAEVVSKLLERLV